MRQGGACSATPAERYRPLLKEAKNDEELLLLEHTAFGVSHDALGAALCESWGLAPPAVRQRALPRRRQQHAASCRCSCSGASICALSAMAHALMTDPDTLDDVARKVGAAGRDSISLLGGARTRRVQEQIEMAVERAKTD